MYTFVLTFSPHLAIFFEILKNYTSGSDPNCLILPPNISRLGSFLVWFGAKDSIYVCNSVQFTFKLVKLKA